MEDKVMLDKQRLNVRGTRLLFLYRAEITKPTLFLRAIFKSLRSEP